MLKILKKIVIIFIIWFALIIVLTQIFRVQDIILKKIYPLDFKEYVCKYTKENDIDPLLTFAIIKAESNFEPNSVSRSKAIGLMQLMEDTALEIAEKEKYTEYESKESLYNPEINIKIGTKYFKVLLENYDGSIELALTAYNAGMGNVRGWINDGTIKEDGSDIENVPYKETNSYVRKIIRDYKIYKDLYKEESFN